ncbi:hypothetical protein ACRAWD_10530 [Caulobacter segnis]
MLWGWAGARWPAFSAQHGLPRNPRLPRLGPDHDRCSGGGRQRTGRSGSSDRDRLSILYGLVLIGPTGAGGQMILFYAVTRGPASA